jgi:hypothetical protein
VASPPSDSDTPSKAPVEIGGLTPTAALSPDIDTPSTIPEVVNILATTEPLSQLTESEIESGNESGNSNQVLYIRQIVRAPTVQSLPTRPRNSQVTSAAILEFAKTRMTRIPPYHLIANKDDDKFMAEASEIIETDAEADHQLRDQQEGRGKSITSGLAASAPIRNVRCRVPDRIQTQVHSRPGPLEQAQILTALAQSTKPVTQSTLRAGTIGSKELDWAVLQDVKADGHCFYHCLAEALHSQKHLLAAYKLRSELSKEIETAVKDTPTWTTGDQRTIFRAVRVLKIAIGIVYTQPPNCRYVKDPHAYQYYYHYGGEYRSTNRLEEVPTLLPLICLACTNEHFLHVVKQVPVQTGARKSLYTRTIQFSEILDSRGGAFVGWEELYTLEADRDKQDRIRIGPSTAANRVELEAAQRRADRVGFGPLDQVSARTRNAFSRVDPTLAPRISNLLSRPPAAQARQCVLRLIRQLTTRLSTGRPGDPKDLTAHLVVKRFPVLFRSTPDGRKIPIATHNSLWFQPTTDSWIPAGTRIKYFDQGGEHISTAEKELREEDNKGGYCMKEGKDRWYDSYRIRGTCQASMANSPYGVVDAEGLPVSANCIYCGSHEAGFWLQATKGIYALPQKNDQPKAAMILVDYVVGPKEYPAEAPKGCKPPPRPSIVLSQNIQLRNMDKTRHIASRRQDMEDSLSLSASPPLLLETFIPIRVETTVGRVTIHTILRAPPLTSSLSMEMAIDSIISAATYRIEITPRDTELAPFIPGPGSVFWALMRTEISSPWIVPQSPSQATEMLTALTTYADQGVQATMTSLRLILQEAHLRDTIIRCRDGGLTSFLGQASELSSQGLSSENLKSLLDGNLFAEFLLPPELYGQWSTGTPKVTWVRYGSPEGSPGPMSLQSICGTQGGADDEWKYVEAKSAFEMMTQHILVEDMMHFRNVLIEDAPFMWTEIEEAALIAAAEILQKLMDLGLFQDIAVPSIGVLNV